MATHKNSAVSGVGNGDRINQYLAANSEAAYLVCDWMAAASPALSISPDLVQRRQGIIDEAFGRGGEALLASLPPCAPFLPPMVAEAGGDMGFAGAFIPLVTIGTVILMPLKAPLLIEGLTIDTWALAKPLLLSILPGWR